MLADAKILQPSATAKRQHLISVASHMLLVLVLFSSGTRIALAVQVQATFSGTVEKIVGSGIPGINPNEPVSGTLRYDATVMDENPAPEAGFYARAITSIYISIGSKSYSLLTSSRSTRNEISIWDDIEINGEYVDHIRFLGSIVENGNSVFHFLQLDFSTKTDAPSVWIETSSVLPVGINLNAADVTEGSIRLDAASFTHSVHFTISNVTTSVIQKSKPVPWLPLLLE